MKRIITSKSYMEANCEGCHIPVGCRAKKEKKKKEKKNMVFQNN